MNKSEIFKAAHALARTFEGNYSACFSLALKIIYRGESEMTTAQELNEKFGVKTKVWESSVNYYVNSFDSDYLDAAIEAAQEIKLKKEFIFVPFRTSKKQDAIKVVGNSYAIKEELKELGFKYNQAPQSGWNLIIEA